MISEELRNEIEKFEEDKQKAIMSYERDGKYLVIAGPGTGKTFTVIKRIQAILNDNEKGTSADRILCLTFSDAAAKEMRRNLEKYNVQNSAGVNIYTFHSFCLNLMEENPELFNMGNKRLITAFQKQTIVKECLEQMPIEYNKKDTSLYSNIDEIVEKIEAFKHYRIEKEDFEKNKKENPEWKIKTEKEIAKIDEAWEIYQKYKELSSKFIDFDDMIDMVLKKFDENPEFLEQTANQFDYIMVDEYQDTNKAQNDIVFKLAKHCKNILVVGDDDQIIYTFQGASLDTIDGFLNEFEADKPEVYCIKENRRSTQTILDVSKTLAELQDSYAERYAETQKTPPITQKRGDYSKWFKNLKKNLNISNDEDDVKKFPFPLRLFSKDKFKKFLPPGATKELIAKNSDLEKINEPVIINSYTNEKYEKAHVVQQIKEIVNDETKCPIDKETNNKLLNEIAVLVKSNSEAEEYASLLKSEGIRVQLVRGKNIFNANSVKTLIAYMQFFNDLSKTNSDKLYHFLLAKPFHINQQDYNILQDKRIKKRNSLLEQLKYAKKLSDDTLKLKDEIKKLKEELSQNNDENKEKIEKELNEKKEKFETDKKYILSDEGKKIQKLIDDYHTLDKYRQGESVKNLIHQMACITGILQSYISLDINRTENIDAINKFIDLAEEYTSTVPDGDFYGFVEYIEALLSSDSEVFTDKTDKPLNAVQISTLHSSKGREFEYVFMPNLINYKYESNSDSVAEIVPLPPKKFTPVTIFDGESDEINDKNSQIKFLNCLKLLFVGMTRAKRHLVLSYRTEGRNTKSYFIQKLEERLKGKENLLKIVDKSDYIPDLVQFNDSYENKLIKALNDLTELKEHISNEHIETFEKALNDIDTLKKHLQFTVLPDEEIRYDYDYSTEFVEYIKQNLKEEYSASSLNTFLDCSKKYLFRYILNLKPYQKRGEKEKSYSMELGNAIHYALEQMVKEVNRTGNYPENQFLKDKFEEGIQEELQKDLEQIKKFIKIEEHEEKLSSYYEHLKTQIEHPQKDTFEAEKTVDYVFTFSDDDNKKKFYVNFSGKIDRLDRNEDGTYNIIDYKTGSPKKKSEFAPDKDYEDYYNQLAIYRYILENQEPKISIKNIKIVQPQLFTDDKEKDNRDFRLVALEGETGYQNCEKVYERYKDSIKKIWQFAKDNSDKETKNQLKEVFKCKEGCKKGGEYFYCDYKSFCKSMII